MRGCKAVTLRINDSQHVSFAISGLATWSAQFCSDMLAGAEVGSLVWKVLDCLPRFADCRQWFLFAC